MSPMNSAPMPLIIGVFGTDPFGGILDRAVEGKLVSGRRVLVRRAPDAAGLRQCHIVFVPASETGRFPQLNDTLDGRNVLTVGEAKGFAERGGIINFVVENQRVRFEINPQAASQANLRLSSKLMQLATIVSGATEKR